MADISKKITRKSIKAKKKAAIKTIKAQSKEKIREVKMQYANNPERKQAKALEKEQKKALRIQKANARVAYNARQPKQYSLGEDLFNSISHGIGAGLSCAAIVLLVLRAVHYTGKSGILVTVFTLFAAAMFLMYMMSTLYHALTPYGARKVFKILNRDGIFLVLAGTVSPFILLYVPGTLGLVAIAFAWAISVALVAVYSSLGAKFEKLSEAITVLYAVIATLIFTVSPIAQSISSYCKAFIAAGTVAYLFGFIFYFMKDRKWAHSVFHIFALAGSILSFFSIYNLIG